MDIKYEVRKLGGNEILENNEFFVIRRQDILALPAIWSYVNTLRTAVDTLHATGYAESEEAQRLEEWAHNIAAMASLWENTSIDDKKLPD